MAKKTENKIEHGSPEHIAGLENAYNVRKPIAEKVVKEFEDGTRDYDIKFYEKCKRLVDRLKDPKPKVVSHREGWKRDRSY